MKNDLQKYKKSDFIKWIIAFALIGVFLVSMLGVILQVFTQYKPSDWFRADVQSVFTTSDNGNDMNISECNVMSITNNVTPLSLTSPSVTEEEIKSLMGMISCKFLSGEELQEWRSVLSVTNDIDSTALNEFIFFRGVGSIIPSEMLSLILPLENVFDNLPNYKLLSIECTVNGVKRTVSEVGNYGIVPLGVYSNVNSQDTSISVRYNLVDDRVVKPLPSAPVKDGHTFVGWYYDEELTQPYDNAPIYEDIELYAKFEINRYKVTFDTDGGSTVTTQVVDWNTSATLTTPTREGYTFVGWFLPDGTQYTDQEIKNDINLTARWEVIMCTVKFYVDGDLYETKSVEYGTHFMNVVEIATTMNLQVVSLSMPNGEIINSINNGMIVSDDLDIQAVNIDGIDKVVSTVKNNKWAVVSGLVGIVVLFVVVMGVSGSVKRKKR